MNQNENSVKVRHSTYLLLAAFLWGTTFVAQSIAMETMEPFTYNMCRFFLGAIVLFPFAALTGRIDPKSINYRGKEIPGVTRPVETRRKTLLVGGIVVGICLFFAGGFQQAGMVYTTAGKSGFVTALYIIIVPVIGFLFFHKKVSPLLIAAIGVAIVGFFLLCIKENFTINRGDLITLGASVMFALHITSVDYFSPRTNGIQLSFLQFLIAGALSMIPAFLLETPNLSIILANWGTIGYAGIFSAGIAYTLQIIGQRGLNPTVASLLMSLESVISALAGWIILGDVLTVKELSGCVLVFAGVILAQLPADLLHRGKNGSV